MEVLNPAKLEKREPTKEGVAVVGGVAKNSLTGFSLSEKIDLKIRTG